MLFKTLCTLYGPRTQGRHPALVHVKAGTTIAGVWEFQYIYL